MFTNAITFILGRLGFLWEQRWQCSSLFTELPSSNQKYPGSFSFPFLNFYLFFLCASSVFLHLRGKKEKGCVWVQQGSYTFLSHQTEGSQNMTSAPQATLKIPRHTNSVDLSILINREFQNMRNGYPKVQNSIMIRCRERFTVFKY